MMCSGRKTAEVKGHWHHSISRRHSVSVIIIVGVDLDHLVSQCLSVSPG